MNVLYVELRQAIFKRNAEKIQQKLGKITENTREPQFHKPQFKKKPEVISMLHHRC